MFTNRCRPPEKADGIRAIFKIGKTSYQVEYAEVDEASAPEVAV